MKTPFFALILSLPARNATERMRAWRSLKSMGCAVLRDGVYLLPSSEEQRENLLTVAKEIQETGGSAELVGVRPLNDNQEHHFRTLFDRTGEYTALVAELERLDPAQPDINQLKRSLRTMRRRFTEIADTDFFPSALRDQTGEKLALLEKALFTRQNPNEPTAFNGGIERHDPADYQGRLWATRANLWVDRLASAWLIKRFIDPGARFLWVTKLDEVPGNALGFDYDKAIFTHVEQRVTFETLLASFGLEDDPALLQIGRIVHSLDLGGDAPETAGLELLIRGMKNRLQDDDAFLSAGGQVLDDVYQYFMENLQ